MTIHFDAAKLSNYQILNNSKDGNPRYKVTFYNNDGILHGKTATNTKVGYKLARYMDGTLANIVAHKTKAGNIIIDYITDH